MVNGMLARIVLCSIWPRLRGRALAKAPPQQALSEEIRERITEDGGKIDFKDMVHEREGIVYEREASADEGSFQSVLAKDPGADAP